MNINKLKYVLAIAEAKNMTKAAASLYISQPGLTKSLNLLEEELGIKLFNRDANPIQLTYAGEIFLEEAKKILDIHGHMMDEIHDVATCRKTRLVLGIPSERGCTYLPYIIPRFLKRYPNVDLQAVEGVNQDLEAGILDGTINLALYTLPCEAPEITFEVIADDPIIIAASKDHPFCRQFDLSLNNTGTAYLIPSSLLEDQRFIALKRGSGVRRIADYLFERHGLKYNISRELARHETTVRMAAEGLDLVVTPMTTPVRTGLGERMAYFSLDTPSLSRKVVFAYQKDRGLSLAGRNLIELTKELMTYIPAMIAPTVNVIPALYASGRGPSSTGM